MITEYKILQRNEATALAGFTNVMIRDGWQPQGGLVVVKYPGARTDYSQAMVKYKIENIVIDDKIGGVTRDVS